MRVFSLIRVIKAKRVVTEGLALVAGSETPPLRNIDQVEPDQG